MIVLAGHPFAHIGRGEDIRSAVRAFRSAGVTVGVKDVYGWHDPDPDLRDEFQNVLVQELSPDLNIFHINADEIEDVLRGLGTDLPKNGYNVIYPMWELSKYPRHWAEQLNRFDEIWVPSRFTYDSIAPSVVKPMVHLPLSGEIQFKSFLGRRYFEIPESSFTFLFFFDFSSYLERKNPFAVLEAFEKLSQLRPNDDLHLVVKVKGGEMYPQEYQRFCEYVERFKTRLMVIDRVLSDNEIKNLLRCCDCFISLHRSEGFGQGLIAAMFLGKPVIATGYSANLDFMNESNSCLVRYQLVPVTHGAYPFGEGQVWAEADVDHAVDQMMKLVSARDDARSIGDEASRHIRVNFSFRATGLRYANRVAEIKAIRSSGRSLQPAGVSSE